MRKALMTVDEFCEDHNMGRTRFYELVRRGEIETVTIGSSRRITREAADAFVARLVAAGGIG